MTLTTEYDVRRLETAHSFKRDVVKWFDEDLETRNESTKNSSHFARACSLTVDRVVDKIN